MRGEEEILRKVGSRHGTEIIPMIKYGGEATRGRWRRGQDRAAGQKQMTAKYTDSL